MTTMAASHTELVLGAMRDPGTYPHPAGAIEVVETHSSWVFLAGDRAYKVKKAVDLGFLDYRTLVRRRELCREEVRLNRRLAPRIYLGTVALVRAERGFALVPDGGPGRDDALEVAVEMRRFAIEDTLAWRARAGTATDADADRIGHLLAGFHLTARRPRDAHPATTALAEAIHTTLDDLEGSSHAAIAPQRLRALRRFLDACCAAAPPSSGTGRRAGWSATATATCAPSTSCSAIRRRWSTASSSTRRCASATSPSTSRSSSWTSRRSVPAG